MEKNIGLNKNEVRILPYNQNWKKLYKQEEELLSCALEKIALEIQHIGSTSIPGAMAKPIIDIAVGVKNLDDAKKCIDPLHGLGYKLEHGSEKWQIFFYKRS